MGGDSRKLKDCIDSQEEFEDYLKEKAKNHQTYRIYSDQLSRITDIVQNHYLYLNDGTNWNDTVDSDELNPPGSTEKIFARCMSYTKSENVAMWMLYGGTQSTGAMLKLRRAQFTRIIQANEIELGEFINGEFRRHTILRKGDFEIYASDIVYYDNINSKDGYTLKRSDDRASHISCDYIKSLRGIKKTFPWNYENECRLIVKVKKEFLKDNDHVVRIHIGKLLDSKHQLTEEQIYHHPNFTGSYKYEARALKGKINWQLCPCARRKEQQEKKAEEKELCYSRV